MRRITIIALLFLTATACKDKNQQTIGPNPEVSVLDSWFGAWELVSQDIYKLPTYQPVDFIFFDDKMVYSTSRVTIAEGHDFDGPTLFSQDLAWKYKAHNGMITLPDGAEIPVGIMSFAGPLDNQKSDTFFIMPLPTFWKNAGVDSRNLSYASFLTGIFVHEFSHTQQMGTFGKAVSKIEANHQFAHVLTDNIVEDYMAENSIYVEQFKKEVSMIYKALEADSGEITIEASKILSMINKRHDQHFTDSLSILKRLDNLFLTMEGVGEYNMYAWLSHPEGGKLSPQQALEGTRRGKWSQDEGLGLAILLSKISPPEEWGGQLFGQGSATLVELLESELEPKSKEE
ncbi:hypothetical protein [Flagellimonas sp. 2504JD4-2]